MLILLLQNYKIFRNEISQKDNSSKQSKPITQIYKELKDKFSVKERGIRINMISTIFSDIVDELEYDNPKSSRKSIINGFTNEQGEKVGGIANIFNEVHKILENQFIDAKEKNDTEKIEKISKTV